MRVPEENAKDEPLANIIKLEEAQWKLCVLKANDILRGGGIVAVPTDTVYGVISLLEHWRKIVAIKRRSDTKPLGLFLEKVEDIAKYTKQTVSLELLHKLLPGPVTVVMARSDALPQEFNQSTSTVGIRVAPTKLIAAMCAETSERALVQSSANLTGSPLSPLCIEDFEAIWSELGLIVDGGPISGGESSRSGSTVIDLSTPGHFRVLREGCALNPVLNILNEAKLFPLPSP